MTTETTTRNFLGIRIDGNITDERKAQRPREELEPIVKAVLDDPLIEEFGWTQFTPYFNDGDTCVFSAQEPWFRTASEPPVDEIDDLDDLQVGYGIHPTLGGDTSSWNQPERYEGSHEQSWRVCRALSQAINDGEFDSVLLQLFGDHAEVTVRRSGIRVETYEHD